MKNVLFALFALFTFGVVSCSSTSGPDESSGMSCRIDGVSWSSTSIIKSGFDPGAYIVGTAEKNGLSELLGLELDSVVAGRTIALGSDSLSFTAPHASLTRADGTWKTRAGSGNVVITEFTGTRVKGTFTCTLYKDGAAGAQTLTVTEGTFNAPF